MDFEKQVTDNVDELTKYVDEMYRLLHDPKRPVYTKENGTLQVDRKLLREVQGRVGNIQYLFPYLNRRSRDYWC